MFFKFNLFLYVVTTSIILATWSCGALGLTENGTFATTPSSSTTGKPCFNFGGDMAESGTWLDGYVMTCYCLNGSWRYCKLPFGNTRLLAWSWLPTNSCIGPFGSLNALDGEWGFNEEWEVCMCNKKQGGWEQCHVELPKPRNCSGVASHTSHGKWGPNDNWQVCLCNNGAWERCTWPNERSCNGTQGKIAHGEWGDNGAGERCKCNNGKWMHCGGYQCLGGRTYHKAQVLFLHDISNSLVSNNSNGTVGLNNDNLDAMRNFTAREIEGLPIDHCLAVGIAEFAGAASFKTVIDFNDPRSTNKSQLLDALRDWEPSTGGDAKLGYALKEARNTLQKGPKKVVVVLTDGTSKDEVDDIAKTLREQDEARIMAVAVGSRADSEGLLLKLTGDERQVLRVDQFADLAQFVQWVQFSISALLE